MNIFNGVEINSGTQLHLTSLSSKTYTFSLERSSGWVFLAELDDQTLEHINDEGLMVALENTDGYEFASYTGRFYICFNRPIGVYSEADFYGIASRMNSDNTVLGRIEYPANDSGGTEATASSFGQFKIEGNKYYIRPTDGFIAAGAYRLSFMW